MRIRTMCSAVLFSLLAGTAGPAFAQGGGADEEVRRAVERAVGSSIASSVAESLSRSIVSEGLQLMPRATLFTSPFYNRTEGDFDFGSFEADTYGGVVGGLFKVHDIFLMHAAVAGAHLTTDVTFDGDKTSIDAHFIEFRLGGDLVFLNTQPVKAWLTLEGGVSNFDTELTDSIWAWRAGPSVTLSVRGGNVLFEPNVGFSFSNTFEDDDADTTTTFQTGFSVKYRGDKWRPQFNFGYAKVIDPDLGDDGFISVGPEILYAVTPSLLVGAAYSYGTPLTSGIDVDSHTVTLQARWTF
jgi:hypothetical protein